MDARKVEAAIQEIKDAAQHKVDEPVLASGLFYRTGGYSSLAMGPLSPLAGVVASGVGKKRAASLPKMFVVAVTPTRVHAFKASQGYGGIRLKDEVAVWSRAGLVVTAEATTVNTKVTIESPAEGEKVVCSTGKDEFSKAVIYAMQEPVAPAAA